MPITTLTPVARRRAFEEILHQLEAAIDSGQIAAGDRLPSERDLAEQLGVSRTSVREALRVLEALGLVGVRPGADHGASLLAEPTNALPRLFALHFGLHHISLASLIDFRAVVEAAAAATVARANDEDTIAELERMIDELGEPGLDQVGFQERDAAFHLLLVRSAGNELATLVLEGVRGAVTKVMLDAIAASGEWTATHGRLVAEHRAILDAIKEGLERRAADLTETHIRNFYEEHLRVEC